MRESIASHLNDDRRGEILKNGVHIAIFGAPNAGKSTLINMLGREDDFYVKLMLTFETAQRKASIVSPVAGTTRDVVDVTLDIGGYPVVLADTAGLRKATNVIEKEGIRIAMDR